MILNKFAPKRLPNPKSRNLSAQKCTPEFWALAHAFLEKHPTMHNRGDLVRVALESYIAQATEFGIDGNWKPRVPGIQEEIYRDAYKKLNVAGWLEGAIEAQEHNGAIEENNVAIAAHDHSEADRKETEL